MEDDDGETPLWKFSGKDFLESFRDAAAEARLDHLLESPYQWRHSGPSRDKLMQLRSENAISERGRWASASSARIYKKAGRVQEALNQLTPEEKEYAEEIRLNFAAYYRGGWAPAPPRVPLRGKGLG